jgi:TetR/AcrR family transcriptional regulator, regulator of cefoperazone and chloramphenicol sensitivity
MKLNVPAVADEQAQTRQQLLEAAGAVFAERGFRNTTVREICQRAGANIAAVNYHFGDKEKLYLEVFRYSRQKELERFPLLRESAALSSEKKLAEFVHSLLQRIFDTGEASWHGQLMLREMIEPTAALDFVVAEKIRPMSEHLRGLVAEILGCRVSDERVRLCGFSVVSQCIFYCHCRPVVERLDPAQTFDADSLAQLAEHITKFSLAGMKPFRAGKK